MCGFFSLFFVPFFFLPFFLSFYNCIFHFRFLFNYFYFWTSEICCYLLQSLPPPLRRDPRNASLHKVFIAINHNTTSSAGSMIREGTGPRGREESTMPMRFSGGEACTTSCINVTVDPTAPPAAAVGKAPVTIRVFRPGITAGVTLCPKISFTGPGCKTHCHHQPRSRAMSTAKTVTAPSPSLTGSQSLPLGRAATRRSSVMLRWSPWHGLR